MKTTVRRLSSLRTPQKLEENAQTVDDHLTKALKQAGGERD